MLVGNYYKPVLCNNIPEEGRPQSKMYFLTVDLFSISYTSLDNEIKACILNVYRHVGINSGFQTCLIAKQSVVFLTTCKDITFCYSERLNEAFSHSNLYVLIHIGAKIVHLV